MHILPSKNSPESKKSNHSLNKRSNKQCPLNSSHGLLKPLKNETKNKLTLFSKLMKTRTAWLHRQTWRGLRNTLILEENATEIAGIMKAKDAPITTGSLVPSHVCNRVLIPATKSSVWIISAFSTYSFHSKQNKNKNWVSNPNNKKKKKNKSSRKS